MDLNWRLLLMAAGLACILEGIPYFLFAERMPRYLRMLSEQPPALLRGMGLAVMLTGLAILFLARSL